MTEPVEKTTIAAGDTYQTAKSASGAVSKHSGDAVALALVGLTLGETYSIASEALDMSIEDLQAKYGHLNDGMQRMNLGNRIRGVANKIDRNNEKARAKGEGEEVGIGGVAYVTELAAPFQEAREKREAEAAEAKAKADAEKAEAAKAKAEAAAAKKAAKELPVEEVAE